MMKLFLLFAFVLITYDTKAQFYKNVNNELCYELYKKSDQLGPYRVFLVIDEETSFSADSTMLKEFSKLGAARKTSVADQWRRSGKRIEIERAPFISYPAKPMNYSKEYNLQKINQKIDWENSPWKDVREFWQYDDRPF
jgi:hypothetical protein